ncbi:MAG TPA: hypothetical protein VK508_14715 [Cyclobacteriaceae bacterium]|nr:hypothetical protein [Cyclobacteriaceae bacterium]
MKFFLLTAVATFVFSGSYSAFSQSPPSKNVIVLTDIEADPDGIIVTIVP